MDQKLNSRFKLQQIQKVFIFATRVNTIDNAQVFKGVLQTGMTHILLIIHVTSQAAEGFFFSFFLLKALREAGETEEMLYVVRRGLAGVQALILNFH